MSTNTNQPPGLPDVAQLQQLANAFFRALPGEAPGAVSLQPEDHPIASGMAETLANSIQLPVFWEDAGAASSGYTAVAGKAPQQQYATGAGRAPVAVAGSGASPSYLQQGNSFNIKEPATSFPDNNLRNITPGAAKAPHSGEWENPFQFDLPPFFQQQHSSQPRVPVSFPLAAAPTPPPSFYFLNEQQFANYGTTSGVQPSQLKHAFGGPAFDAYAIRNDFPILVKEKVNGKSLVWLDNAATTQKPQLVIDRISSFYQHENSNIHRAAHELAARATDAYEAAREKVRAFLGARSANEIIFVRGATEAINLVAQSWGEQHLAPGDEIIVSHLEHHANIVPWKRLADKKGLTLKVIPVDDDGQILLDAYAKLLTPKTRLVAFTQVSNALGTVTPAQQIIAMAHAAGAKVLVDGAQSVSHIPVNVQALDADWFAFSGHKVFGPTGIGVLYGKEHLLNATEPWQGGGNMIKDVTFEEIQYHPAPNRFEAGTGNIADAVGLGAAIDYVTKIGLPAINQYEHWLLEYATYHMKQIPGLRLIGTAPDKASVLSFNLKGHSNDEVGKALNKEGIAVRTGHHCAQPILRRMGVETSVRPSLAFYNTCEDVDRLVSTLWRLVK
ncbi:cysteine desulfurase/selenocysteine lyase [Filimonas zeae]|uniref:cysteine desulfurase n=1 Tax=Filimonas zeae TaxID=1737353 RepID=A0A917MX58_9BACT|nr:family 2A encapsulin nanocompartment cargo protein cysteine desulfurase [Filimonas zeae]MDR6340209.1 cysteine desulfurase/selenocysteine lyase [Filimonas zeae]GGH71667.1 cysteine desulfurase [Filimonas zeae]